jgi:cytoskeletal protein RodZ
MNNDDQNPSTINDNPDVGLPSEDSTVPELKFGEWLKSRRLARKVSLEEIAAVTKVHLSQLKALEEGDLSKLPATAFVRGFIVSYSRHLELDENEALTRFKAQHSDGASITDLLVPETNKLARSQSFPKVRIVTSPHYKATAAVTPELDAKPKSYSKPRFWIISLVVAGVVTGLTTLIWLGKSASDVKETPKTASSTPTPTSTSTPTTASTPSAQTPASPAATKAQSAVQPTTTVPAAKPSVAPPAASTANTTSMAGPGFNKSIEIRPLEDSFVNVRVDDGVAQGVNLKAGQTQQFAYNSRITFAFSNAGAVEIRMDGVTYSPPGARGDVKRVSIPEQVGTLVPRPTVRAAPRVVPPAPDAAAPITPAAPAALGTSTLDGSSPTSESRPE